MGAYFGVIRRELAARKFSQAFIDNLELILTGLNSTTTTADAATASLAALLAVVTALQAEVDAIEPDAALLAPLASGELPGGAVGQVQYNSNGVFGGFTVSGDGTLDTSTGAFTLATVPVLKGGTGATTAAGARTNLGLAIGIDVQAFDADLSALAALSSTGLIVRTGSGTVSTRTLTAPAAGISVSNGDGVSGNPTLALANDLAALEALSGTNTIYYRSGVDTWSAVTFSGLTFSGGVLTASAGSGTVTHTAGALTSGQLVFGNGSADITVGDLSGDVSTSGSGVTTIGANKVTNAMLRQSGALAVVGRSANSTGNVADIQATAASDAVLRESGSTIGFGTIATGGIANDAVTYAKIQNAAANTFIARAASSSGDLSEVALSASQLAGRGSTGDVAAIVLGSGLSMSGTTLNASGGTGSASEVLIETLTPAGSSSFTTSTIAGTYRDLHIVVRSRGTTAATNTGLNFTVNGDTGANYDFTDLRGNNSSASDQGNVTQTSWQSQTTAASGPANVATTHDIYIYGYAGTTFHKDGVFTRNLKNGTAFSNIFVDIQSLFWRSTAAITTVTGTLGAGNFDTGTTVSVYGRY